MMSKSFQPEIINDDFYYAIKDTVEKYKPKTILEIGSANGLGSTRAFAESMSDDTWLFCLETNKDRYDELILNVCDYKKKITCLNASSVPLWREMTNEQIEKFIDEHPKFDCSHYGKDVVKGWKVGEDKNVTDFNLVQNGIEVIKKTNDIVAFDCVLMDGGPFSGEAEYEQVKDSGIIMLDDINDIKNYEVCKKLMEMCMGDNPTHRLLKNNFILRNGYAIFQKR
jgi:hypothetical protein